MARRHVRRVVFSVLGIETYPDQLEPTNQDAAIWRFLNMRKFRDLMTTAELYFRRADLFPDEREGLPPEEYLATFGLHPFDVNDRRQFKRNCRLSSHQDAVAAGIVPGVGGNRESFRARVAYGRTGAYAQDGSARIPAEESERRTPSRRV